MIPREDGELLVRLAIEPEIGFVGGGVGGGKALNVAQPKDLRQRFEEETVHTQL